jgi:hypothetical protein
MYLAVRGSHQLLRMVTSRARPSTMRASDSFGSSGEAGSLLRVKPQNHVPNAWGRVLHTLGMQMLLDPMQQTCQAAGFAGLIRIQLLC